MRMAFLCLFLFNAMLECHGQGRVIDRVLLRQSFQSKNDKAEPGVFTFTKPKNKNESWLLNLAIGYDLLRNSNLVLSVSPYIEYHKNTLIDKEQDNWQIGIAAELQSQNLTISKWSPIIISSLKYNKDKIKLNTSFQGNLYFTVIFKGKGLKEKYFWIPNNASNFGKIFQFTYTPYIGFENENRIETATDSSFGSIYRIYFRIASNISLFPSHKKLKGKFEFNLDWQYRINFHETVLDLTIHEHRYFTTGFNYIFFNSVDEKKSAKIGIDYTNGENPSKNFESQSFYAITLKVKL